MKFTNIRVTEETKKRFNTFGFYGDGADNILNRIMNMAEKNNVRETEADKYEKKTNQN